MSNLSSTKSPNLPIAPNTYARQHFDILNNVLRLYFSRIDGLFQSLLGSLGGAYLDFPNGAFHQDGYTTLTNAIPNSSSTAAIVVASTSMFASAGTILIGKELISYLMKLK
jgi:hypothetical protein